MIILSLPVVASTSRLQVVVSWSLPENFCPIDTSVKGKVNGKDQIQYISVIDRTACILSSLSNL